MMLSDMEAASIVESQAAAMGDSLDRLLGDGGGGGGKKGKGKDRDRKGKGKDRGDKGEGKGKGKRRRDDGDDDRKPLDEETKKRKIMYITSKYHETEQQLALLQQQAQALMSNPTSLAASQGQLELLQKQQQEMLVQQEKRKEEYQRLLLGAKAGGSKREAPMREMVDGMECEGVVKNYDADKNFGFIGCDDLPKDVYFRMPRGRPPPGVGTLLSFELKIKPDGRCHASNVTLAGDAKKRPRTAAEQPEQMAQLTESGEVASATISYEELRTHQFQLESGEIVGFEDLTPEEQADRKSVV